MRVVLEKMDWGNELTAEQKAKPTDIESPRKEALIRFGRIGADVLADDDDVVIVIAPQNVVGAMVIDLLDEMCKSAAGRPGEPFTLIASIYVPICLVHLNSHLLNHLFNLSLPNHTTSLVTSPHHNPTVILLNPSLGDRPSSNNVMQIRGRSERRAIQDSFVDIFTVRLLYPSSGSYLAPPIISLPHLLTPPLPHL